MSELKDGVLTFTRPPGGWRSIEQLIAEHPEAFTISNGLPDHGSRCQFCGNAAAICRCDQ